MISEYIKNTVMCCLIKHVAVQETIREPPLFTIVHIAQSMLAPENGMYIAFGLHFWLNDEISLHYQS